MVPLAPLPFEVKILQLLQEIRSLSVQRPGLIPSSGDGQRASHPRPSGEILRKFALLDWILVLENRQRGPRPEEEYLALDRCKALVQTAKVELKATPEDVRAMSIASIAEDIGGRRLDFFPLYLQLPARVVRDEILSYLTTPQDKLNLIKAIPSEGPLMRWNKGSLRLQAAFPILMRRKFLDWKSINTLTRLNCEVKRWITQYFEDRLLVDLWRSWPQDRRTDVNALSVLLQPDVGNRKEWNELLNPLANVSVHFQNAIQVDEARLQPILEPLGANIWSLHINQKIAILPSHLLTRIRSVLTLTPNLRKLELVGLNGLALGSVRDLEFERKAIEEIELPPLPSLKTFSFRNFNQSPELALVTMKILDAYGSHLEHLKFNPMISYPPSPGTFRLASLTTLNIVDYHLNLTDSIRILSAFVDSPLKALHLHIRDVDARSHIPQLLRFLSVHFGETLECLKLQPGCVLHYNARPTPSPPPSTTWMLDVSFPKLNYFGMDDFPQPNDFNFLLCFPVLEQLFFECWEEHPREEMFAKEMILQMSVRRENICASNIWKVFPGLRVYGFHGLGYPYFVPRGNEESRRFLRLLARPVTRAECEAFQRRH